MESIENLEDKRNLEDCRQDNEKDFWILGKVKNVCDKIKVIFS